MKKLSLYLIAALGFTNIYAQHINDTLGNHSPGVTLEAGKYTAGNDWGFYAGHNSKEQQQFGEKYLIDDHVHVLGVIAHLTTSTGTVSNPHFEIDFRLWAVDPATGKPSGNNSLDDGHLHLEDANLGAATVIMFHEETHVDDAFFVSMDLGDYAHDGLAGDTVGLFYAPNGSRSATDIATVPFRNVFQAHGHGAAPNWKDFYTQFTTPMAIATHIALYPIVEMETTSLAKVRKNGLQVMSPYPNPANAELVFPLSLTKAAEMSFSIMDISGKVIKTVNAGTLQPGNHEQKLDISDLPKGNYILSAISSEGAVGVKFNKL